MAAFKYRARSKAGKVIVGRIDAPSIQFAEDTLSERGLQVILLEETRERFTISWLHGRVTARELVILFRQLSTLSGANVPLVQSLRTIVAQTTNHELKRVLALVADDVEGGARLSFACAKHPRIFTNFFVSMLKSGETAGRLAEVLEYLANQTEKEYDLVSKVRGALIYPAFIVFGMLAVGVVLLVFVIPQLTQVLIESGAELPLTTRMLITSSDFMRSFWWLILIFIVAAFGAFRWGLRFSDFRLRVDTWKLRMPILGTLLQKIYLARITRSLQILISGGVDAVGALEVTSDVVGNKYYEELLRETKREVADGSPMTTVLQQSPLVPGMVSQMLTVGEETGQFTAILDKLTGFYTREVDNAVTTLVSVIEPLLMVVIGIGVGLVVASIILPMYRLAGQF
ncbi:type II secretion system F family protein [Candidatus Uhrbacteria bacterium]|nr:type II secretion system F family protein [Candidatus Uhrbacteria bacterium]